jgi:hypothetical protein
MKNELSYNWRYMKSGYVQISICDILFACYERVIQPSNTWKLQVVLTLRDIWRETRRFQGGLGMWVTLKPSYVPPVAPRGSYGSLNGELQELESVLKRCFNRLQNISLCMHINIYDLLFSTFLAQYHQSYKILFFRNSVKNMFSATEVVWAVSDI